ncbi:MAG: DUF6949 family protein [Beijerinckiaceae bacterium]
MFGLEVAQVEAFKALVFGFLMAGLVHSGFRYFTDRAPSFTLLQRGGMAALASVPLVVLAAPYMILRNTIRGRKFERRSMVFVWLATVIACLWSMAAGRVILDLVFGLAS